MKKNDCQLISKVCSLWKSKLFRIMRMAMFIVVMSIVQVFAINSYSQSNRLSLSLKNVSAKTVLQQIEEKSQFFFIYDATVVDVEKNVSIELKDESITKILDELFVGTNVIYKINNRQIALSTETSVNQQQKSISGKITDSTRAPLPGVSVVVKGTTTGTITDVNGKYSISNIPENAILLFSFIGMKAQEVVVGTKSTINVMLDEETIGIEEVVAIGYGTVRKADLTGSVSTVSSKDFDKIPAASALDALQGKASGLQITTNSGMPGASSDILIRGVGSINGSTSPIFVVDGMITTTIDNLNPSSIESVSILKDASSSAIYGARAANGVILVTTKRGEGKKNIEVSLNSYLGVQTESNLKLKLLNASQFLELWTESYQNSGLDLPWNDEILAHYKGIDTNWKNLMMQTGVIQNYNLSITGGSEKSNYYVSAGLLDNKGMVINTNFNKYTVTINTDHKINDWIKFGNSLNIYSEKRQGTVAKGGIIEEPYTIALRKVPLTRVYEENGDYGHIFNSSLEHMHANPIWMAKETGNEIIDKGLQGNLYLSLKPLEGLEFITRGNMDYSNRYSSYFRPGVPPIYGWEATNVNSVDKVYDETTHWSSEFLLNYNKTISKDHEVKLLLGYSLEESKNEYLSGSRTGTPNNEIRFLDAGNPSSQLNGNSFSDWAFTSMFGRINYNFKDKYLLTATIRRDGTSRLTQSNRFGIFPSASIAWRASQEEFLKKVEFINDLKVRASFGTLGNILSVSEYGTIASLSEQNAVFNSEPAQGYTLTSAVNKDLRWESASKKNLGIDATFWNNKLYTTIDYFIEDTYDLLFSDPIPYSTGLSGNPLINAGRIRNKGYELLIGYRSKKADWAYDLSFNLSHVKNKVVDLGDRNLRTSGLEEGYPVRSFFGYKANGIIYNESQLSIYNQGTFTNKGIGDIALLDIDGYDNDGNLTGTPDGKVDAADRTIIGKKYPDFIYGFLGTISYKNWSFQAQIQGVNGIDINYGPTGSDAVVLMTSWARNEDARILNRYHPTKNPTGTWPILSKSNTGSNDTFSDFWLQDASYLRIKNVNLNYNLPKNYCSKLGLRELGLYVSVQNAYTFTKYDGPEVDTTSDPLTGIPQPRTWTLGLKVTF